LRAGSSTFRADEITIVFCGSKKSLVNGIPIASLLFAGHAGLVVIPLMLFHQIQLMVCASLARHYAARGVTASDTLPALAAPSEACSEAARPQA
jgi:sodium/bile acid cotransporter 7